MSFGSHSFRKVANSTIIPFINIICPKGLRKVPFVFQNVKTMVTASTQASSVLIPLDPERVPSHPVSPELQLLPQPQESLTFPLRPEEGPPEILWIMSAGATMLSVPCTCPERPGNYPVRTLHHSDCGSFKPQCHKGSTLWSLKHCLSKNSATVKSHNCLHKGCVLD